MASDRVAMEALLTRDEIRALGEVCRFRGVAVQQWHLCPSIAHYVEALALTRRMIELQDAGLSELNARRMAYGQFRLSEDADRKARDRWTNRPPQDADSDLP